jgi:shikimate dehydrogenase
MPQSTYGILGYPVEHSLSPLMHNTAFKALKVDATYKLFSLKEDELDDFFKELRQKDSSIFGLNVTVPYKERVIPYLDSLSPFAEKARAVNTIVISKARQLAGHNTDGPGFLAHLGELRFDLSDKRVVILGAGGTTRAILTSLALVPERPPSIHIFNRTYAKAEALVRDLGQRLDVSSVKVVSSLEELNIELADLLINTTSVGLNNPYESPVGKEFLHAHLLAYDVIYKPKETLLLKMAREKGAQTANGLGMLFYQGMLAFQHWANRELDGALKAKIRQELEKAIVK